MSAAPAPLLLGIDGGGSTCRARLAAVDGRVLADGRAGPANISTDLRQAIASILAAADDAFARAGIVPSSRAGVRAVFGMAGGNDEAAAAGLAAHPFPFAAWRVTSDAETACAGAHDGRDGAILILGTGSQGYGRRGDARYRVGGWGFALSDGGSGAVVGQRVARRALAAHEGLAPASPFTRAVMAGHGDDPSRMLSWARGAAPADWARLAPDLFAFAEAGDPVALELRAGAVADVEGLVDRLVTLGAERVALVGGLAAAYRPCLAPRLAGRLTMPAGDALAGALRLAGEADWS